LPQEQDKRFHDADEFKRLHSGPDLLVLTNAWDAVSARVVVDLGVKAIATSSAAVAWSHGYPDGNALPAPLLLTTARNIVRVASVPVTADIEAGYSDDPRSVADLVSALIDAGVVGINLEDGSASPDLLCAKIQAVRQAAHESGVPLFINARTDVFIRNLTSESDRLTEAVSRATRYSAAGADGIFVPGVTDPAAIEHLAGQIPRPLNVMARPGLPAAQVLQRLGVRRLSCATWFARAALRTVTEAATAFLANGDSDVLAAASGTWVNYNALFSAPSPG
jgi:2-methylisocitrate lyase-like PEP mutase family enzyme